MKYLNTLLVTFLIAVSLPAFSQNTVLWEISGNGITTPSYLFGTVKFMGVKEYRIPKEANEYIRKARIFAVEDQVDHHAQHELNKAVHFPKGKSLKTELPASDYQRIQQFFEKEFNISAAKFEANYANLIPLALSITMTRLSLGEDVKFYDIELLKIAKENKLETFSLENIEREAEALHRYPMKDQIKALLHSVENFEVQKEEFRKLMAAYPYGSLKEIFEYTLHPTENNPAFIEEFYTKRNEEWLPKIEKMVHDKPAFLALGISHLEGEKGILKLLTSKGYTLTPVPLTR